MKKLIIFTILLITTLSQIGFAETENKFDLEAAKRLPAQEDGRIKPLDTIARNLLLMIHGKQTLQYKNRKISPIKWLLDMTMDPGTSKQYPVFRIDHPEVLSLINKSQGDGKYYSFKDILSHIDRIQKLAVAVAEIPERDLDQYQNAVLMLAQQIYVYERLNNTLFLAESQNPKKDIEKLNFFLQNPEKNLKNDSLIKELRTIINEESMLSNLAYFQNLTPLENSDESRWYNMGEGYLLSLNNLLMHPELQLYAAMIDAYQQKNSVSFNANLHNLQKIISTKHPNIASSMSMEVYYNKIQPFYIAIIVYLFSFILTVISWIYLPKSLYRIALSLLIIGFFIHTLGLISRMIIEGRPPVTNLYSSAVFVGWGSVLMAIILEKIYKNSFGIAVSSIIGSLTLIIAHHLASKGETMEMMRAVLNSNFWLSTHVVTITIGYSATFLAGFIGCLYIIKQTIIKTFDQKLSREMGKMVYGVISFALFFSFVGTVLGGIWADQSWGRFWGWDPKENGALLIILWNAAVLHAAHFRLITTRVFMVLAVFGNIITSFSWFGVNMLGVGLHSYGTTDRAFFWLTIFISSQILFMILGATNFHSNRRCDN